MFPLTGPKAVAIAVDRSHTNALYGMGEVNRQWNQTIAGVHALLNVLTQEDYVYVVFFAGDLLPFAGPIAEQLWRLCSRLYQQKKAFKKGSIGYRSQLDKMCLFHRLNFVHFA